MIFVFEAQVTAGVAPQPKTNACQPGEQYKLSPRGRLFTAFRWFRLHDKMRFEPMLHKHALLVFLRLFRTPSGLASIDPIIGGREDHVVDSMRLEFLMER